MSFRIMYSIPFCGLFLLWYHNVLINLAIYFSLILGKMNLLLSSSLWFFSVTKVIFVKESDLPHFFFLQKTGRKLFLDHSVKTSEVLDFSEISIYSRQLL